ncbi:MAG TPA: cyclic nucleotide-binding domain-containing protein [Myxococcales bacterium]|nr:cyclic nucleotide-binding domain-containing protein [Myxococcales bacterium]
MADWSRGMALQGPALTLAGCELFKDFSETGLSILATISAERAVPLGVPLFVEGMASDALFVLKSGRIRVLLKDADGTDREVGMLGPGEALGQLSLLQTNGTRLATAVAADASEIVEIRSRDFLRLQAQKPQACIKLMMAIAGQVGRLLGQNRDLLRSMARARPPAKG